MRQRLEARRGCCETRRGVPTGEVRRVRRGRSCSRWDRGTAGSGRPSRPRKRRRDLDEAIACSRRLRHLDIPIASCAPIAERYAEKDKGRRETGNMRRGGPRLLPRRAQKRIEIVALLVTSQFLRRPALSLRRCGKVVDRAGQVCGARGGPIVPRETGGLGDHRRARVARPRAERNGVSRGRARTQARSPWCREPGRGRRWMFEWKADPRHRQDRRAPRGIASRGLLLFRRARSATLHRPTAAIAGPRTVPGRRNRKWRGGGGLGHLMLGMRLGEGARAIVTTTPQPGPVLKPPICSAASSPWADGRHPDSAADFRSAMRAT